MFPRHFSGEITNWPRLPCYSLRKSRKIARVQLREVRKETIASLLTLNFQAFEETQVLAA